MRQTAIVFLVALVLVSMPFCGKKETPEEKAAKQMTEALGKVAEQMSDAEEATEKMKEASEAMHGGEIVTADRDTLVAALPQLDGWEMQNPRYQKTSFSGIEVANVDVDYAGPEGREVSVTLTDAATASAMLAPLKMVFSMKVETEDDSGYQKVGTVNGIPVIEKYDKEDQEAEFSIILKDRYIINLETRGEGSLDILKKFVTAFDIGKLQ
jgi:hypothetical protein